MEEAEEEEEAGKITGKQRPRKKNKVAPFPPPPPPGMEGRRRRMFLPLQRDLRKGEDETKGEGEERFCLASLGERGGRRGDEKKQHFCFPSQRDSGRQLADAATKMGWNREKSSPPPPDAIGFILHGHSSSFFLSCRCGKMSVRCCATLC